MTTVCLALRTERTKVCSRCVREVSRQTASGGKRVLDEKYCNICIRLRGTIQPLAAHHHPSNIHEHLALFCVAETLQGAGLFHHVELLVLQQVF